MPKIIYRKHRFLSSSMEVIDASNKIIEKYAALGLTLSARQLFYAHVSRGFMPNTEREYKRLLKTIENARMAGLIDWDAIEDRTRFMRGRTHWESPYEIVAVCAKTYCLDMWDNQTVRVQCWIEKDALVGVIENVCRENDVPYFACRGFSSASAMWRSAMEAKKYWKSGSSAKKQPTIILYLGDHDPSGIDMTRDVQERMNILSLGAKVKVIRLALNMDQVEQYNPPPNPAKETDSRSAAYIEKYGSESWELDALDPTVIEKLVLSHIMKYKDPLAWAERDVLQEKHRARLAECAEQLKEETDE